MAALTLSRRSGKADAASRAPPEGGRSRANLRPGTRSPAKWREARRMPMTGHIRWTGSQPGEPLAAQHVAEGSSSFLVAAATCCQRHEDSGCFFAPAPRSQIPRSLTHKAKKNKNGEEQKESRKQLTTNNMSGNGAPGFSLFPCNTQTKLIRHAQFPRGRVRVRGWGWGWGGPPLFAVMIFYDFNSFFPVLATEERVCTNWV